MSSINYAKKDNLIYTDGSQEYNEDKINYENVAAIGMYIRYNNGEYRISQPIGNKTTEFDRMLPRTKVFIVHRMLLHGPLHQRIQRLNVL